MKLTNITDEIRQNILDRADFLYAMYEGYVTAGFSENQAMALMCAEVSATIAGANDG